MRILFLGDIFGKPGRRIVKNHLEWLREELRADMVIANTENAAAGKGGPVGGPNPPGAGKGGNGGPIGGPNGGDGAAHVRGALGIVW